MHMDLNVGLVRPYKRANLEEFKNDQNEGKDRGAREHDKESSNTAKRDSLPSIVASMQAKFISDWFFYSFTPRSPVCLQLG